MRDKDFMVKTSREGNFLTNHHLMPCFPPNIILLLLNSSSIMEILEFIEDYHLMSRDIPLEGLHLQMNMDFPFEGLHQLMSRGISLEDLHLNQLMSKGILLKGLHQLMSRDIPVGDHQLMSRDILLTTCRSSSSNHPSISMTLTLLLLLPIIIIIRTSFTLTKNTVLKEALDPNSFLLLLQALVHIMTDTTQSMAILVSPIILLHQDIQEEEGLNEGRNLSGVIHDMNAGGVDLLHLLQGVVYILSNDGGPGGILHSGASGSSTMMETHERGGVRRNGRPEKE